MSYYDQMHFAHIPYGKTGHILERYLIQSASQEVHQAISSFIVNI